MVPARNHRLPRMLRCRRPDSQPHLVTSHRRRPSVDLRVVPRGGFQVMPRESVHVSVRVVGGPVRDPAVVLATAAQAAGPRLPLGLEIYRPSGNRLTSAKIALGRRLFPETAPPLLIPVTWATVHSGDIRNTLGPERVLDGFEPTRLAPLPFWPPVEHHGGRLRRVAHDCSHDEELTVATGCEPVSQTDERVGHEQWHWRVEREPVQPARECD